MSLYKKFFEYFSNISQIISESPDRELWLHSNSLKVAALFFDFLCLFLLLCVPPQLDTERAKRLGEGSGTKIPSTVTYDGPNVWPGYHLDLGWALVYALFLIQFITLSRLRNSRCGPLYLSNRNIMGKSWRALIFIRIPRLSPTWPSLLSLSLGL